MLPPRLLDAELRASGGAVDPADVDAQRALARRIGAAELLVATATVDSGRFTLAGNVIDVRTGGFRHALHASAGADSIPHVVDAFAKELLVRESGSAPGALPDLLSRDMGALLAYLRGVEHYRRGRYESAMAEYSAALARDSTFALAAMELSTASVMAGNHSANRDALTAAWRHLDRLNPADARYLRMIAGPRFPGTSSSSEQLGDWDGFIADVPDRWEAPFFLGDRLYHEGDYIGAPEARPRARSAFRRVLAVDSTIAPALEHAIDLAVVDGDTADVRRLVARYLRHNAGSDNAAFIRWRVARFLGDDDALRRVLSEFATTSASSLTKIAVSAQLSGIGLEDAQTANGELLRRAIESPDVWIAYWQLRSLAFNMGRPETARQWTMDTPTVIGVPADPLLRALEALAFGGDSAIAARAVARERAAALAALGRTGPLTSADAYRVCALAAWAMRVYDPALMARAVATLRAVRDSIATGRTAFITVCAALVDAELAVRQRRADAGIAVDRLDSLLKSGPATNPTLRAVAVLTVARLLEARGEVARALAAVRRRPYIMDIQGTDGLAPQLREEGRLALMVADTVGAIRAWTHFLALRANPEPSLARETGDIRRTLETLVARRARRS